MISRAVRDSAQTSSSEEFRGNCAWIQMFPSSSSGMNSRPNSGTSASETATTAANTASVSQRCLRHRSNCRA